MTFGKKVRFIDLFAGIGGFHHAALKVFPDAECVMAVELDDDCKRVYSATFEGIDLRGDIRDVLSVTKGGRKREATTAEILNENLVPEHDILFAGFPCQPFSKGGVQAGLTDSTRGTLFHEIIRMVGLLARPCMTPSIGSYLHAPSRPPQVRGRTSGQPATFHP